MKRQKSFTVAVSGIIVLLLFSNVLLAQQKLGDNLGSHQAAKTLQMNNRQVLNSSGIAIGTTAIVGGNSIGLQLAGGKAIQVTNVANLNQITTPVSGMLAFNTTEQILYVYQSGGWAALLMVKLPAGQIWVGDDDSGGLAVPRTVTGDVNFSNAGAASIAENAVTSGKIFDGTIAAIDISNNAAIASKIANSAVTSDKILDGTISSDDLANGVVTSAAILDGTILAEDMADNAITSVEVLNSTISAADLGNNEINSDKILDLTILAADFANGGIIAAKIEDGAVDSDRILDETILVADFANNAITSDKILDATILAADFSDNAVTSAKIPSSTTLDAQRPFTAAHIRDNAVTVSKITPGSVNQELRTNSSGVAEWLNPILKISSSSNLTLNSTTQLQTGRQLLLLNSNSLATVRFTLPTGYVFTTTRFGNGVNTIDLKAGGSVTLNVTEAGRVDIMGTNTPAAVMRVPRWAYLRFPGEDGTRHGNSTVPSDNGFFVFNSVQRTGTLTSTINYILLEAGKTYEIEACLGMHDNSTGNLPFFYYQWSLGGQNLGNYGLAIGHPHYVAPWNGTNAKYIFTVPQNSTGADLELKLRVVSKEPGLHLLNAYTSFASVIEVR